MDLKHELGIRDTPLAISIGRCDTPKDYESSIRAVATVKDLHLVIVGDGVLLPRLRRLAQNLAIAHRVHFLGHRNDVIALLKGADFFIQASRWEGFGIAAVEAMAVGLPVIVTDVPGLGDVVGEAGLKFRPGDETSLAACISRMLHDTVLRSQMAIASHARSLEFDIRSTSRQHADLYRLLLSTN
jgi:glycosyltransferase involved in cell wall biosynthesis